MRNLDLIRTAISNGLRSKTRTILTVVAIFVGAFTLTLTSAIGTGINSYIDNTLSTIGADDILTVTKTVPDTSDGPQVYDPDATTVAGEFGDTVETVTPEGIAQVTDVAGVTGVTPTLQVNIDWIATASSEQYLAALGARIPGMQLTLAAGEQLDYEAAGYEVAMPASFVEPLGFATADDAVGSTVQIAVTDATGAAHTTEATVVAVSEQGLFGGASFSANDALVTNLYESQSVGLADGAAERYAGLSVRFDTTMSDADVTAMRAELTDRGYTSVTFDEQLGTISTVVSALVLVLNGFAAIALLAAGFGIVNTLLMSVQERTREIGLMKAVGMPGGKIFGLFSMEAAFIGFLGSMLGVLAGVGLGVVGNSILGGSLLADLPGLVLFGFNPVSLVTIVLAVMAIAFVAGTIPAYRAARKDPIEALRYE
jgi:putative ABC transport system permease protein